VTDLLGGQTLADVSSWADEVKKTDPKTEPWHYVRVPLDEQKYDAKYSGDVPCKGSIVDKINEFTLVIKDKRKPIADRRTALKFLIHCIEDLHQPFHVVGGSHAWTVSYFGNNMALHQVWDEEIINRSGKTDADLLKDLAELGNDEIRQSWMKGTPEQWATESLQLAKAASKVPSDNHLGDDYQTTRFPNVQKRLCQAGLRLAWVLNTAFADEGSSSPP
jgi:hypothetical protein